MKIYKLKKLLGSQIFTVEFTKKDGTKRVMNARLGVKKHLKGGKKAYDAESKGLLTVYDLTSKDYRTVTVSNIKKIKTQGVTIEF